MNFLNKPRTGSQFRAFINLKDKKIFLVNHKCGLSYYETTFVQNHSGIQSHIDIHNCYQLGDWGIATQHSELKQFRKDYTESKFCKVMITRNPYERLLSFFTNTFWDCWKDPVKRGYSDLYKAVLGSEYKKLLASAANNDLKKAFNLMIKKFFINPNDAAKLHMQGNEGYGDEHLTPQVKIMRGFTDVETIDIKDGPPEGKHSGKIAEFLGMEMRASTANRSSASDITDSRSLFYPENLAYIANHYRHDFELGYSA